MKLDVALQRVSRLFIDSAPAIYFVEASPHYGMLVREIFLRINQGLITGVTSPVTLAESLVVPVRDGDARLQRDFIDLITAGNNIQFQTLGVGSGLPTAEVRALYNLTLPDAFQAAVALLTGCDAFLTNDGVFRRVPGLRVLLVDDLEL